MKSVYQLNKKIGTFDYVGFLHITGGQYNACLLDVPMGEIPNSTFL